MHYLPYAYDFMSKVCNINAVYLFIIKCTQVSLITVMDTTILFLFNHVQTPLVIHFCFNRLLKWLLIVVE